MATAQTKIYLSVNGRTQPATLSENEATAELVSLLSGGNITIHMKEYGGFEKVGELPCSLPTSDSRITTVPGDIMLYQGNNVVIFYGSNTWSYTRLGTIDGATASTLREFLGSGDVTITISLDQPSNINAAISDGLHKDTVHDLNGKPLSRSNLSPGIYIINGKKTLIH